MENTMTSPLEAQGVTNPAPLPFNIKSSDSDAVYIMLNTGRLIELDRYTSMQPTLPDKRLITRFSAVLKDLEVPHQLRDTKSNPKVILQRDPDSYLGNHMETLIISSIPSEGISYIMVNALNWSKLGLTGNPQVTFTFVANNPIQICYKLIEYNLFPILKGGFRG
jgi:hypothetical protein